MAKGHRKLGTRHEPGYTVDARYSAPCALCGATWELGARVSCLSSVPGKLPGTWRNKWVHAECYQKHANGNGTAPAVVNVEPIDDDDDSQPDPAPERLPPLAPAPAAGSLDAIVAAIADAAARDALQRYGLAHLDGLDAKIGEAVAAALAASPVARTVLEVRPLPEVPDPAPEEPCHPALARALKLALAGKPILLVGPAGCGKSYLAGQIARKLGRPYFETSLTAGVTEWALVGRLAPTGAAGSF